MYGNNNNNNRRLVTLAEHTSDHGKQTNSITKERGEKNHKNTKELLLILLIIIITITITIIIIIRQRSLAVQRLITIILIGINPRQSA